MIDLGMNMLVDQGLLRVQEEPELDIALPQVFTQPDLPTLQRGRLANPEALIAQIHRRHASDPEAALGPDYQELVTEFQPLFAWTTACWDYLLSTEGCRFLPRRGEVKAGVRGDYRAVTDKDYSRIVHIMFRRCVFDFAQQPEAPLVAPWLRQRLWPMILDAYRQLENPPDKRQRVLSPYSYLRCVPYQFLNDFHQVLVDSTVARLPEVERRAIEAYFFNFFTEAASADSLGWPLDTLQSSLRQGLVKLLVNDRLVYCLLRQIERY